MKIEVSLFDEEPTSYSLKGSSIYIGRSPQCDVVINHESMSRKHCHIEVEDGKIFITDLGSTNGVSIDGVKITPNDKTFYLNSLPLMIGGAQIKVDLSDDSSLRREIPKVQSQPTTEIKKPISKTRKEKEVAEKSSSIKKEAPKIKELALAIISILIFLAMAIWHFSQE